MKHPIKIAVIGGTGKSGSYLVKALTSQGFPVRLLVRNPAKFQHDYSQVQIIQGNVNDYAKVRELLEGCDAVISTLGLGIPASEPSIFTTSTTHVLEAMAKTGVSRYLVTTGLNVNSPFDKKGVKSQMATDWMKANYPVSTQNKQEEFAILSKSTVDWTLVRLPMIEQTDEVSEIDISLEDCPGDKISATNLANFLIEQLTETTYIRKAPFIADK
jgi:putative NADH-flavin reductase